MSKLQYHCLKFELGTAIIQTIDQLNNFLKIMDTDCSSIKC